jgi:hypothetical protein
MTSTLREATPVFVDPFDISSPYFDIFWSIDLSHRDGFPLYTMSIHLFCKAGLMEWLLREYRKADSLRHEQG